jgi:hypothetical protein
MIAWKSGKHGEIGAKSYIQRGAEEYVTVFSA